MVRSTSTGYLRLPSISANTIVFVTEDDLWSVPAEGGPARRLTADMLGVGRPALSPDARFVAFTSEVQGQPDIYVIPAAGGMARRLTWLGRPGAGLMKLDGRTSALGWAPDGRIVFRSDAGQPFGSLTMAYALSKDGDQAPQRLPYGPVNDVSYGPGGGVVIGRSTTDAALWKRYRGGTAGAIWIDREGGGSFEPLLRSEDIEGNLASPMWVGERVYFLSDHEGIGNLYSCSLSGADVVRHTDHSEHYARLAASDGTTIVYQVAGQLWLYDPSSDRAEEVPVELASPRAQRQPRFVRADRYLGSYQLDHAGKRLVLDARGKLFSFAPFDGPVLQHGLRQGARYRLPSFLGERADIVAVSDASGEEAIEIHQGSVPAGGEGDTRAGVHHLEVPGLGRVVELVPSPDGSWLAVTNHQDQLLLVAADGGGARLLDESPLGRPSGPTWSPDSRWIAYSFPARGKTSHIKLAEVTGEGTFAVTEAQFRDSCPSFDPTGKYLYFLSLRTFDPVYDRLFLDLGFPRGARPYLVTLQAGTPSPFLVRPEPERPPEDKDSDKDDDDGAGGAAQAAPGTVRVDLEGISERVLEVPVPEARYEALVALKNKVLLLTRPLDGALDGDLWSTEPSADGFLEWYDLVEDRIETVVADVADIAISGDRGHLAYTTSSSGGRRSLRVIATPTKSGDEHDSGLSSRSNGFVDLGRVRVLVDPGAEWAQMVREAWRLQLEQFWTADLSGVDWRLALDRYLPLTDRVATRTELSDLIWELQGELGTSHCYELGGEYREPPGWGQAHLGADFDRDASGRWVVTRIVPGTSWHSREISPLLTPGAAVDVGAAVLAVNGQPVDPVAGLGPLLANQAGLPVQLIVAGPRPQGSQAPDPAPRTIVVPTLADDRPLRYREWVVSNRARVRQATGGRAGYLHVPDMMPLGWAELHRSYLVEVEQDALVVDARFNGGGHLSELVLEKLARRRIGWSVPRRGAPVSYPDEAPRGPLVLLTNEWAGSDGDIFTHGFRMLGLGPVVGTRTWGGVIGVDVAQPLVDGSVTTQPEWAFWFDDVGWGVENHGADPDEVVTITPQDYAAGRDPQLERAIELVLEALECRGPAGPEPGQRPDKGLPALPPRKARGPGPPGRAPEEADRCPPRA
jgi:tricorn protease